MNWTVAKYGPRTFGYGRTGGPAILMVRPASKDEDVESAEFRALLLAVLNGLQLAEDAAVNA